ncbi:MAG: hypothetical protein KatS3mg061_3588 [Dehalococcoidia bacterium]|nr:MAG: hypothetical protein KatS3mg061_3588 [Dehalococcoidia bacterium]
MRVHLRHRPLQDLGPPAQEAEQARAEALAAAPYLGRLQLDPAFRRVHMGGRIPSALPTPCAAPLIAVDAQEIPLLGLQQLLQDALGAQPEQEPLQLDSRPTASLPSNSSANSFATRSDGNILSMALRSSFCPPGLASNPATGYRNASLLQEL